MTRVTLANFGARVGWPRITYPITFNGRTFSVEELGLIQTLTRDCAGLPRTELAATLCELLDWRRPTGGGYPSAGYPSKMGAALRRTHPSEWVSEYASDPPAVGTPRIVLRLGFGPF